MNSNTSTNTIVRQLKIDLITDTPNRIIEWFNGIWNTLCIIETNVYHKDGEEFVYYVVNDLGKQWFFYQDDKNDRFWCNYNHYWAFLENKLSINYSGIQEITKLLVDNALNNSVATPQNTSKYIPNTVDDTLNKSVAIPQDAKGYQWCKVDNAFKNIVVTPSIDVLKDGYEVDKALNSNNHG